MWYHSKWNKKKISPSPFFFPSGEKGRRREEKEGKGEFSTASTCLQKVRVWKSNTDQNKYSTE